MEQDILQIKHISKSFSLQDANLDVLSDVSLSISRNEIFGILGHSGCGKTTLLRIICRLETEDEGEVILEGHRVQNASKDILMLFQNFDQLLPWKTVLGNLVQPMLTTGMAGEKKEAKEIALNFLKEVGLHDFAESYPSQLSGGMKQRVALVRALALKPKVLVMDEPFASLDHTIKKQLQKMTRDECKRRGMTVIFVTHDIEEAVEMADRFAVMEANPGRIRQTVNNDYISSGKDTDKDKMMLGILEQLG